MNKPFRIVVVFLLFILLSSCIFLAIFRPCPKIKNAEHEITVANNEVYLEADITPRQFTLFEYINLFRINSDGNEVFIMDLSDNSDPLRIWYGNGVTAKIKLINEHQLGLLDENQYYFVVYSVDGMEGCLDIIFVHFMFEKNNDETRFHILDEFPAELEHDGSSDKYLFPN